MRPVILLLEFQEKHNVFPLYHLCKSDEGAYADLLYDFWLSEQSQAKPRAILTMFRLAAVHNKPF